MEEQLRAIRLRFGQRVQRSGFGFPVAVVDSSRCLGCGLCEEFCPTEAISTEDTASVDASRCTGCGQCIEFCPGAAISLKAAG